MEWYEINNIEELDSPALVLYKDRIQENIQRAIEMAGDVDRLRPHVKTNKMAEVCRMMMDAGIRKFKCATIAEAEMLAMLGAPDVFLAYQPAGPKATRLLALAENYPGTTFSCVVDNKETAVRLDQLFSASGKTLRLYIDLNNGMNRSGIKTEHAYTLFEALAKMRSLDFTGLHVYDGHLRDPELQVRQQKSDRDMKAVLELKSKIETALNRKINLVAGGSPSFPTHIRREAECSPGTFVFWDWGYKHILPDEPFEYAALVITRIISVVDEHTVTTDLGHKSVAAENPFPRVHFLNAPEAAPVGQSEEHLVLKVRDSRHYKVGDVLYGVPVHICPTVALYETAHVCQFHHVAETWKVLARDRRILV